MTADDVKFSIDARAQPQDGLGLHRHRDQERDRQGQVHGRHQDEVPVGPDGRRHRALQQLDHAQELRRQDQEGVLRRPGRNRPVQVGSLDQGQGDQVRHATTSTGRRASRTWTASTWTYVADDNTRLLQLKGGQAHIDEFPGWAQVKPLKATPGVTMTLFPSTRTDYVLFNQHFKPFQDVHVRRAISYLIDRKALIKAILFGNGTRGQLVPAAAGAVLRPEVAGHPVQRREGQGGDGQVDRARTASRRRSRRSRARSTRRPSRRSSRRPASRSASRSTSSRRTATRGRPTGRPRRTRA